MNLDMILIGFAALVVLMIAGVIAFRRLPRKLNVAQFTEEWQALQGLCRDKDAWPIAIAEADRLLDKALKRRRFKGKSMGERMVSAQRRISNNDSMWFAHNLYKKLAADPKLRLREADVKAALIGFRQALKDIGALDNGQSRDT